MRTRASLSSDLRSLGLRAGDTILCHASLRSLGYVCGGATAVVQALLDVLGDEGTLIVPAQTPHNRDPSTWTDPAYADQPRDEKTLEIIRQNLPAFQPEMSPSQGMGVIAELVRTWPGAHRSAHPQTSFAGVGPRAGSLLAGHALESPLGEQSPLARLEECDARVLLLGVGMNRATAFHLAEYRVPGAPRRMNSCAVLNGTERVWTSYPGIVLDDSDFHQLGKAFETETRDVVSGMIGAATCRLFEIRQAVRFACQWLRRNRMADDSADRGAISSPPAFSGSHPSQQ